MTDKARGFRGTLIDFDERAGVGAPALRRIDDGLMMVRNGLIVEVGPAAAMLERHSGALEVTDYSGRILMPGFIDAHVHSVQTDVIASHGTRLLEWLERYTFPEEARFSDRAHANEVADFFLDELLRNGTTTAAVYLSVHSASVEALFEAASRRRMRMIAGKVMMDRNCPEPLREDTRRSYEDSEALIERWHGKGRLSYAVTPRFAATSTETQLELAGRLLDEHPSVYLQTHIAETQEEIRWIAELYPWSRSYLDVYDHYGLVRERALYAHCIHFEDDDWKRFAAAGAVAVHCPTSNLFLGSGLFDIGRARAAGASLSLGTDVGGGTSFSMLRTMHEAYKVAQLTHSPFSATDAFYMATLGAARALGISDKIGSLAPGREADFNVLRLDATPLMARRMNRAATLEEKLFVLMMLGDERSIEATYVLGTAVA
jgi:guanine deaminase